MISKRQPASDRTATFEANTVETKLLESPDVVSALVDESADYDLTITGATRVGVIQKFVFGTIPETVAERAQTTVIMTKRDLDVRSRHKVSVDKLRERVSGSPNEMVRKETERDVRD
ncbi:hypothetical protein [Halodesulfurarchaeum sp.]|uniref:hypothetical protein n=1 Tax=Halodesulfurarchaeum sp. TaxID=1980530 RepID=UPI002FC3C44E